MHGRPRVSVAAEQAAERDGAKRKEVEKARAYRQLQDQVLECHRKKDFSQEAMAKSSSLLERNPDVYSAWNYRKAALKQHLGEAASVEEKTKLISQELQLIEAALRTNHKSYGAWHHRKWIFLLPELDPGQSRGAGATSLPLQSTAGAAAADGEETPGKEGVGGEKRRKKESTGASEERAEGAEGEGVDASDGTKQDDNKGREDGPSAHAPSVSGVPEAAKEEREEKERQNEATLVDVTPVGVKFVGGESAEEISLRRKREFGLIAKLLQADDRNFHGWDYRRFAASISQQPPAAELQFVTAKINDNFSNYSAWHYRSKLLLQAKEVSSSSVQTPHSSTPPPSSLSASPSPSLSSSDLDSEYELVRQAFFTEPEDQSGWIYLLWLLQQTLPPPSPSLVASWPQDKCVIDGPDSTVLLLFSEPVLGVDAESVWVEGAQAVAPDGRPCGVGGAGNGGPRVGEKETMGVGLAGGVGSSGREADAMGGVPRDAASLEEAKECSKAETARGEGALLWRPLAASDRGGASRVWLGRVSVGPAANEDVPSDEKASDAMDGKLLVRVSVGSSGSIRTVDGRPLESPLTLQFEFVAGVAASGDHRHHHQRAGSSSSAAAAAAAVAPDAAPAAPAATRLSSDKGSSKDNPVGAETMVLDIVWPSSKFQKQELVYGEAEELLISGNSRTLESVVGATAADVASCDWRLEIIEHEVCVCRELLELEPESKWVMLTLARLLLAFKYLCKISEEGLSPSPDPEDVRMNRSLDGEVMDLLLTVEIIDPFRENFYREKINELLSKKRAPYEMEVTTTAQEDVPRVWKSLAGRKLQSLNPWVPRLLGIKFLDLSNNSLTSAEGLEALHQLQCLDLSHNKIVDNNMSSTRNLKQHNMCAY